MIRRIGWTGIAWVAGWALAGCWVQNPVAEVGAPTELEFNQWLLSRIYLYPEKLAVANGQALAKSVATDSLAVQNVQKLYQALQDPFTSYAPPATATAVETQITTSSAPGSLGLEWVKNNAEAYPLAVARVYPESPGAGADLRKNDRLMRYNGVALSGERASSLFDSLFNADVHARMAFLRGADTVLVDMDKRSVAVPTVFVDSLGDIPVIQIRRFVDLSLNGAGTAAEFREALRQTAGAAGRILSVVGNPGGEIRQCVQAADEIVPAGFSLTHIIAHGFNGHGVANVDTTHFASTAGGLGEGNRLVLLVAKNSASCAEIFAAALAEAAGVPLVGDTTYGKGVGQTVWPTPAGGLALITSMEVRTPLLNDYHGQGVVPQYLADYGTMLSTALGLLEGVSAKRHAISVGQGDELLYFAAQTDIAGGAGAWLPGEILP